MRHLLTVLLLVGLALRPVHAAAPRDNCTGFIGSVPAVISTPGTWCLSQNLATAITSGDAITVASDDVVLDCNDFGIDGTGAGLATGAIGIHAVTRNRTIVRHCTVRGFYRGIWLEGDASRDLVEDNHLDQNTHAGISVQATDSTIRHNLLTRTGGTTAAPAASAFGIVASYNTVNGLNDVLDNTIVGVQATAGSGKSAYGISTDSLLVGEVIRGNKVSGLVPDTVAVFGINVLEYTRGAIRNNELVTAATTSVTMGIECSGSDGLSLPDVRVKNNVISGFQYSDLSTCGDAGRNDFNP